VGCNLSFQPDLQALRAAGILPVFAGGNFGPAGSTSVSPANNTEALAVGAVDGTGTIDATSSRGPSACGAASTTYPELVAPGVSIRTADRYGTFQVATGTSEAAPHVAGALALLLAAHPGLTAAQQAAALESGATDLGTTGPDNTYGSGMLDVLAAHDWLVANPPPPTTVTQAVSVPALAKGYGYWVTIATGGIDRIHATWTLPGNVQATLAIYAGNPFVGTPDPVKMSPPTGSLASASGRVTELAATTAPMPSGQYTVYFYASGALGASAGSVTYRR
jgi:subtilisin family serine protease